MKQNDHQQSFIMKNNQMDKRTIKNTKIKSGDAVTIINKEEAVVSLDH